MKEQSVRMVAMGDGESCKVRPRDQICFRHHVSEW